MTPLDIARHVLAQHARIGQRVSTPEELNALPTGTELYRVGSHWRLYRDTAGWFYVDGRRAEIGLVDLSSFDHTILSIPGATVDHALALARAVIASETQLLADFLPAAEKQAVQDFAQHLPDAKETATLLTLASACTSRDHWVHAGGRTLQHACGDTVVMRSTEGARFVAAASPDLVRGVVRGLVHALALLPVLDKKRKQAEEELATLRAAATYALAMARAYTGGPVLEEAHEALAKALRGRE